MTVNTELLGEFRKDAGIAILIMLIVGLPSLFIIYGAFTDGFNFLQLLIGVGMAAFTILVAAEGYQARVLLYSDRLVHQTLFGSKSINLNTRTQFYHRCEIHQINGVETSRHNFATITEGGNRLKLNSAICDHALMHWLLLFQRETVLPALVDSYHAGEYIDFGAVQLHKNILYYKKRHLALNEISRMRIEDGVFTVYSILNQRVFFKLKISKIANFLALACLLEKLTPS